MVGRHVSFTVDKKPATPGKTILEVDDLSMKSKEGHKAALKDVSFRVHAGEIVTIAGIEGNGQTDLVDAITGLSKVQHGKIILNGNDITKGSIHKRIKDGMSHIPEDRHKHGLVLDFSLEENMVLERYRQKQFSKSGWIRFKNRQENVNRIISEYDVRSSLGGNTTARSMSGGNQQKAIVGRELDKAHDLLVAVQPTRGLDVGAIESIHKRIIQDRDEGHAVLLISLELDEVMNLSDLIYVIYEGEIVALFKGGTVTSEEMGLYMAGGKKMTAEEINAVLKMEGGDND